MAKTFRSWDVDQGWLLPPSVHEFVPEGHLAHFVRDTVRGDSHLQLSMRAAPVVAPTEVRLLCVDSRGYCEGP